MYQADTIEIDKSLTDEEKFKYILTVIDNFSKYAWVHPLVSKNSELIRDKLLFFYYNWISWFFYTDNGKEF